MQKMIILLGVLASVLWASNAPFPGYEREIDKAGVLHYVHKKSQFKLVFKKLIDSENIYNGGKIDNYDDGYIATILEGLKPFGLVGKADKNIAIVFKDEANKKNFLEEFGLDIFKKEKLSISLYMMDMSRVSLPLNLQVYPLFVMRDRFVQGVISKGLLKGLIAESNYSAVKSPISAEELQNRLGKKYKMTKKDVEIHYNKNIELFEIRKKGEDKINAYVSKEGRYILLQ